MGKNNVPSPASPVVASFDKHALHPLRWPLSPIKGESLIGFIARLAAHNTMGTTRRILRAAAFDSVHCGDVTFHQTTGALKELARLAQTQLSEIEALTCESASTGNRRSTVSWGGEQLPSYMIGIRPRRIAPTALAISNHHRADWMNSMLPYCSETFELLIDACPECGANLRWTSAWGIGRCEDRHHDVPSSNTFLPEELRAGYELFARLISHDVETRQIARGELGPAFSGSTSPEIIARVLSLGRLKRPRSERMVGYQKMMADPLGQAKVISAGMAYLADWPAKIRDVSQKALCNREDQQYISDRLRRLIRYEQAAGHLPLFANALPELSVSARMQSPSGPESIMLTRELKALANIEPADVTVLRKGKLLGTKIVHRGERTQTQFDKALAMEFAVAKKGSLDAGQIAQVLCIPAYAVDQLVESNRLVIDSHPALAALPRFGNITKTSLEALKASLAKSAMTFGPKEVTINLRQVMRAFGGGFKPWGGLFGLMLDGELDFQIVQGSGRPSAKTLQIRSADVDMVNRRLAIVKGNRHREGWLTMLEMEDFINAAYTQVAELEKTSVIKFERRGNAKVVSARNALELAKERIFPAEAGAVLGHRHSSIGVKLAAMGLNVLPGGGYDRRAFVTATRHQA